MTIGTAGHATQQTRQAHQLGGLTDVTLLVIAGSLLTWANTFINNEVHSQLSAQQIYFPAKGSTAIAGPQFAEMQQYAGQQLTTGAQAKT